MFTNNEVGSNLSLKTRRMLEVAQNMWDKGRDKQMHTQKQKPIFQPNITFLHGLPSFRNRDAAASVTTAFVIYSLLCLTGMRK